MSNTILKEVFEWVKVIIIAIVLAFLITSFVKPTLVNGESMVPTLEPKDYLLMNRMAYKNEPPTHGDIIVFESELKDDKGNAKDLVKRVIGVAGDHIVVADGDVWRNDELLVEEYINEGVTDDNVDIIVPEGQIFVMGDNRLNSTDSRSELVGTVSVDKIMGKIFVRLFPFNKITTNFS
ncbi:MAG: signal peptidase I [Filifactoraceae bacterium]